MPIVTSFALGCKLESKTSGIVYTKTAPDRWEPTPEGLSYGWQPFQATDEVVLASKSEFKPRTMFGRKQNNK